MSRPKYEEYPLPIHWASHGPPADLAPSFRRFDGLGAEAVNALLREDRSGIRTPAVASFRDAIANFTPTSLIRSDDDDWYDPDHPDPRREWAEAFFIYATFSGDKVLLKENGEVAWALAAERRMRPMASSFPEFLEQCAICYRDDGAWDYYRWVERLDRFDGIDRLNRGESSSSQ